MPKNASERIIELLKESGKNQPELADILPVSVSTISRWFSGDTKHISKDKRELIANIMKFDLGYIETGRSNRSQLDLAHDAINRAEENTSDYIASGLHQDDPVKLLELAESLIRTARLAFEKKRT
ncbi:MAG: helix-turn-helix transcriptional regulator [Balneola sp.]